MDYGNSEIDRLGCADGEQPRKANGREWTVLISLFQDEEGVGDGIEQHGKRQHRKTRRM